MSRAKKNGKMNGMNGKMNGKSNPITGIHGLIPPTMGETFTGKNLMVTGVSGFLGKVWLAMVLDYLPEVGKISVVLRGKKDQSAHERFVRIFERSPVFRPLREKLGQGLRTLIAEKIELVDARITEPFAGLDADVAAEKMADIDVVVHFAGLTDFEPDPQWAIDANIHGAWHVADLAAMSRGKRYVHCSTTYVAGVKDGVIPESITPGISPNGTPFDPRAEVRALEQRLPDIETKAERLAFAQARGLELGYQNVYTFTKSLSEHLIDGRSDVTTTTFRPAIVECARNYPFAGWNEGINTSGPLVWLLSTPFRRLPARGDNIFDVTPVDTVARSMVLVVADALRDEAHEIYQCGSGHLNPFTIGRAMDLSTLGLRRSRRKGLDKHVVSRIDSYCMEDATDREQIFGYNRVRQSARLMRDFLRDFELDRVLPPTIYDRINGEQIDESLRNLSKTCRAVDRKLGQVDDMLRQYKPFIYDHNYTFRTDNLKASTEKLNDADRELFGFDIADLDWREYWTKVQIPGLEKWSIPLLKGEKVPDDEALPPARDGVRARGALPEESREDEEIRATA